MLVLRHLLLGRGTPLVSTTRRVHRTLATKAGDNWEPERMRNVGILAHIDAGKTTVTERFLFYSGVLDHIGEVHDGDTTMDYLEQERERGITINSAAISFDWLGHAVNLIDTPGHVDFTIEVERSVRVLDGAVALFDGVAGVEAQSETVWAQAEQYGVPRIAFVNKMDRVGADYARTVKMIEDRLGATPIVTQLPIGSANNFRGIVDLVDLNAYTFSGDKLDKTYDRIPILSDDGALLSSGDEHVDTVYEEALQARENMIEQLAVLDEQLSDFYLEQSDAPGGLGHTGMTTVTPSLVRDALRRVTLAQQHNSDSDGAVPVLCGSALKNTAVQPLMEAIVNYLPSPVDRDAATGNVVSSGQAVKLPVVDPATPPSQQPFCALAFKVQHCRQRGPLVFFRVYSGELKTRSVVQNVNQNCKERPNPILRIAADDSEPLSVIRAGDIGVGVGMKKTFSGDTLIDPKAPKNKQLLLPSLHIPKPVFTASVELETSAEEKKMQEALSIMTRDDPSLQLEYDEETGQLLLGGMGELHLEVTKDRINTTFNLNISLGKMRVAYRETLLEQVQESFTFERVVSDQDQFAKVTLRVVPMEDLSVDPQVVCEDVLDGEQVSIKDEETGIFRRIHAKKRGQADGEPLHTLSQEGSVAIHTGILNACGRGAKLGFPLQGVRIEIVQEECEFEVSTTPSSLGAAAYSAMMKLMPNASPALLEPIVNLRIQVPDWAVGAVIADLNANRRAMVHDVGSSEKSLQDANNKSASFAVNHYRVEIDADTPLREIVGYATTLRSTTSGEGSFSATFSRYDLVNEAMIPQIEHDVTY